AIFTRTVKNRELVKLEGHFGAEALRILRDVPGVTVETAGAARGGGRGDAVLRYGPAAEAVAVEVKRRANAATAWQIVQQSRAADPTALLDLWTEENTDRIVRRVRAYRLAREPRELAGAVSDGLDAAGIDHAVTGAAAAARIAPFVTAVPVAEVWIDSVASLD